jgi:hypothetical protein
VTETAAATETDENGREAVTGELEPWEPQARTVVRYVEESRDVVDGWVQHAASVFRLAEYVCGTEFVPKGMRNNPAAVAACILAGRELGVGPMTSLRHVQVVEGSPSLSAEYKRARVLQKGHEFAILELTTTRCRVRARRRGLPEPLEITYTIDDARRANLVKPRGAWETRPRRMLFARASSEVCDFMFSDLVNGLPTTELLLEGEYDELSNIEEPSGEGSASPGRRHAQRKTPAGDRQQKAGSPDKAQAATAPEPPLPGEEDEPERRPTSRPAARSQSRATGKSARPATRTSGKTPAAGEPTGAAPPPQDPAGPDGAPANPEPADTARMIAKIQTMFGKTFGIKGRDDKLRVVSALAGREVLSSTDLSHDECRAVLDSMERAAAEGDDNLTQDDRSRRLWAIVDAWEDSQRPAGEREDDDDFYDPDDPDNEEDT